MRAIQLSEGPIWGGFFVLHELCMRFLVRVVADVHVTQPAEHASAVGQPPRL